MRKLKKEFDGIGEVRGFHFRQIHEGDKFYIYEVTEPELGTQTRYEVVAKTYNQLYDCESYPGSKSFGLKGWSAATLDIAIRRCAIEFGIDPEVLKKVL